MKSFPARASIPLLTFLLWGGPVSAGGLSTPGQGARALSMAGAYTAVADDGSAVFYNPAGVSQIDGTTIEGGVAVVAPQLRYRPPGGATEESTKGAVAPALFITRRLTDRFSAGIGLYAPYARDAAFANDLANGFPSQRSKIVRTDLGAVVSYRTSDTFSIGGGLIVGYSELDRSIAVPTGPGSYLRINDNMDGVGVGGIVGVLWKISDRLKAGATYRTEMSIDHKGDRIIVGAGTSNARAKVRYPASFALGIAFTPSYDLTLALDADWTGWSSMDQVTTRTAAGSTTTPLNARDTWAIRIGGEYRLPAGWAVRAGYAYSQGAFPSTTIIPAQPDANGQEIGFGIGKTTGAWSFDLAYHYALTPETTASANINGYNGKYNIDQHLVGLTATYRF